MFLKRSRRSEARKFQTKLAEASIETALLITKGRSGKMIFRKMYEEFPLAVLGLGKLGGGGMDYGSDLDLVLVYDEFRSRFKSKFAKFQSIYNFEPTCNF